MAFKVGDMVKRIDGNWRGVREGDIKKVSYAGRDAIELEGFPDIRFDAAKFELVQEVGPTIFPSAGVTLTYNRQFKIGDRVRMIANREMKYGRGAVPAEEVGVIVGTDYDGDWECQFPSEPDCDWTVHNDDLEHVDPDPDAPQGQQDEISLDEAVENYKNISQQLKDLSIQAETLKKIMHRHGIRPV